MFQLRRATDKRRELYSSRVDITQDEGHANSHILSPQSMTVHLASLKRHRYILDPLEGVTYLLLSHAGQLRGSPPSETCLYDVCQRFSRGLVLFAHAPRLRATARISSAELGWVGLGFYYIKGNAAWRTLLGLQHAPAAFMLIASFWTPFSPRWLIMKGREDEALEVLRKLHEGIEGYEEDFYVKELHQIKTQYQIDKANKLGLVAIFKKKSYRKRMYLILLFVSFRQFARIIPLQNYQVTIYTKLGFTNVFSPRS
ncbi:hypothetical protein Z517_09294 [Fonsecaea pedrosoi CBS 271.37]|uniref:Major facilitator superfamily (MFS) profile domain-containing protein n=1 Tax=Fonsecaea pedrosoi CBS 271.37 TaxID=1442368 RepID=A0A0D2GDV6_9EURO|nr:uncharacterized protein Z517_09294 [Fonsecaea pedrosoi CBS 271.37]KIW76850.1 hypothetical protein Z517_09294 [Fonsecaea pedrosoi CBS 271.37]